MEVLGIFLMLAALVSLFARPDNRFARFIMGTSVAILVCDVLGRWINADGEIGMLIEHSLRVIAPVLWCYGSTKSSSSDTVNISLTVPVTTVAAALTFVGHGLYAAGLHSAPLSFQMMTSKIFGWGEEGVRLFLLAAGIADFACAIGVFISAAKRAALLYMIIWGFLTATARFVSHPIVDPWLFENLARSPHWMLPLWLWITLNRAK